MKNLGIKILELRKNGCSYDKIAKEIGCSKSVVAYYCNNTTKEKTTIRAKKRKEENPEKVLGEKKVCNFKNRKPSEIKDTRFTSLNYQFAKIDKISRFKRRLFGNNSNTKINTEDNFYFKDIVEKFKNKEYCYLTGRKVELNNPSSYSLDHVIPVSKGGKNTLDNLMICCPQANFAKNEMLLEEFIELCKDVLVNFEYNVSKKKSNKKLLKHKR